MQVGCMQVGCMQVGCARTYVEHDGEDHVDEGAKAKEAAEGEEAHAEAGEEDGYRLQEAHRLGSKPRVWRGGRTRDEKSSRGDAGVDQKRVGHDLGGGGEEDDDPVRGVVSPLHDGVGVAESLARRPEPATHGEGADPQKAGSKSASERMKLGDESRCAEQQVSKRVHRRNVRPAQDDKEATQHLWLAQGAAGERDACSPCIPPTQETPMDPMKPFYADYM